MHFSTHSAVKPYLILGLNAIAYVCNLSTALLCALCKRQRATTMTMIYHPPPPFPSSLRAATSTRTVPCARPRGSQRPPVPPARRETAGDARRGRRFSTIRAMAQSEARRHRCRVYGAASARPCSFSSVPAATHATIISRGRSIPDGRCRMAPSRRCASKIDAVALESMDLGDDGAAVRTRDMGASQKDEGGARSLLTSWRSERVRRSPSARSRNLLILFSGRGRWKMRSRRAPGRRGFGFYIFFRRRRPSEREPPRAQF